LVSAIIASAQSKIISKVNPHYRLLPSLISEDYILKDEDLSFEKSNQILKKFNHY
jgi:hypothetical protein